MVERPDDPHEALDAVRELGQQGLRATEIAKRLNIARTSVYRALTV